MDEQNLQELDSSPYTPKDSINIRKFFKVHQACNQLNEAMKEIYANALTSEELESFNQSSSELENAIGSSPASYIASYLKDIKDTIDIGQVFEHYSFDGDHSPVHEFIKYPVVSDPNLETLAFIHKSYPNMNVNLTETQKILMSNERLEFLGDSWLGAFVAYIIYEKYPFADEGALSKMKSAIVSNNNLEKICTRLGFKERLKENVPRFSMKIRDKFSKYYADCVEAYIGALVIDRFSTEFKEISDWLEELSQDQFEEMGYEMTKKPLNKNAKGELGELLQFNKLGAKIEYKRLTATPPFTVEVSLGDNVLAIATGQNVKEAEQRAAMEVLANRQLIQKFSLHELETNDAAKYLMEEIPVRDGVLPGHKVHDIETPVSINRSPLSQVNGSQSEPILLEHQADLNDKMEIDKSKSSSLVPDVINNLNNVYISKPDPVPDHVEMEINDEGDDSDGSEQDDIDDLTKMVMSKLSTVIGSIISDTVAEKHKNKKSKCSIPSEKTSVSVESSVQEFGKVPAQTSSLHNTPSIPHMSTASSISSSQNQRILLTQNQNILNTQTGIPPLPPKPVKRNDSPPVIAKENDYTSAINSRKPNLSSYDMPNQFQNMKPKTTPLTMQAPDSINNQVPHSNNIDYNKNASATLYNALGGLNLYPQYEISPMPEGGFKAVCSIMGIGTILAEGTGRGKKIAQHIAASRALQSDALQQVLRNGG